MTTRPHPVLRLAACLLAGFLPLAAGLAAEGHPSPAAKAPRPELGTGAAFAPDGTLLAVVKDDQHLLLRRSRDDGATWSDPVRVNAIPEAIAADGDSRPKLAFAADGGVLVTWARPLPKPYTGEIRLARSDDGGASFNPPITVHHDRAEITHRFESIAVGKDGRVTVAWIDKRDLEGAKATRQAYRGAAIYAAQSSDHGRSFGRETKLADHSCECCRTAVSHDADGAPLVFWRHVFALNERDHALARLTPDGRPEAVQRATFEAWKVDACPHHGPSLAVDEGGTRHAVWFNQKDGVGHVYYGRLQRVGNAIRVDGQRTVGGPRAAHADLNVAGQRLAIVWKEFDGEKTRLSALLSADGGRSFSPHEVGATEGASDQPRVLARGDRLFAFWRTAREGLRLHPLP